MEGSFERARHTHGVKPEIQALDGVDKIVAAGLSADGSKLTVAEEYEYSLFDLPRKTRVTRSTGIDRIRSLSGDGGTALVMGGTAEIPIFRCLDVKSGLLLPPLPLTESAGAVSELGVALSNDGVLVAVSTESADDKTSDNVLVWECRTGKLKAKLLPERSYVDGPAYLVFSPSSKMIGLSGMIGTVVVWDIERKSIVLEDATSCQCDATELLSLCVGRIFWALNETVLLTQSSNPERRAYQLKQTAPLPAVVPERVIAVLEDGHTALNTPYYERMQATDLLTGATQEFVGSNDESSPIVGRKVVKGPGTKRRLELGSLYTGDHEVLTERHSAPFASLTVEGNTLKIGGRTPLRFALPPARHQAKLPRAQANPLRIMFNESRIEIWDQDGTVRPWFSCMWPQDPPSSITPQMLGESVFFEKCGTELAFSTIAAPGTTARLRRIENTDTAYALFADGTAELFGHIEDFRKVARCVAGTLSYPLDLCEDELVVPGKFQALLFQSTAR